ASGHFGFIQLHFNRAGTITPLRALNAQLLEFTHPAFVTRTAGLNPFTNPNFLLRQLTIEFGALSFLSIEQRLPAAEV
ncbi:MAG: hypothetical protein JZU63_00215, partial [Rhodoferax sp.]|nr:hypothetical protein [Rhodoferax sp.]